MNKLWKTSCDLVSETLHVAYANGETATVPLYGHEAFRILSHLWLKVGWSCKYSYGFSWMGRPIIQLPEDILRIQEVIEKVRPDFIVETGVAHGGSSVFYASLFEVFGHGRVISIDVELRPHNRKALEEHRLKKRINLIERSSTAPETLHDVRSLIPSGSKVMVVLDSNHSKKHVREELELYSPLVISGSYVVVADGNMEDLYDVPGGRAEWSKDNPKTAVHEFVASHPEFEIDGEPTRSGITYWKDGYLRRK